MDSLSPRFLRLPVVDYIGSADFACRKVVCQRYDVFIEAGVFVEVKSGLGIGASQRFAVGDVDSGSDDQRGT